MKRSQRAECHILIEDKLIKTKLVINSSNLCAYVPIHRCEGKERFYSSHYFSRITWQFDQPNPTLTIFLKHNSDKQNYSRHYLNFHDNTSRGIQNIYDFNLRDIIVLNYQSNLKSFIKTT